MARDFVPMTRTDFASAIAAFNWKKPKTSVHVHHTWRPNHSQYRGLKTIQAMWIYHTEKNGWSDIAQHVSIAPDGTIWSGRNWNADPASAAGFNAGAFMFETIGDFDNGKDGLQGEQLQSVLTVTATILIAFGLQAWTAIRFHNEMSSKTYPGSSVVRASFVPAVIAKKKELENGFSGVLSTLSLEGAARAALNAVAAAPEVDAAENAELEHEENEAAAQVFDEDVSFLGTLSVGIDRPVPLPIVAEVKSLGAEMASGNGDEMLFAELALRTQAIGAPPDAMEPLVVREHLAALGRRIFKRLHRELHALLCGAADADRDDREKLRAAFGLGADAVTAVLVGIMTTSLAIAQPVAVVAAAIIMRRLLAPTYLETCSYWGEHLD